jgi:hypothetical protein
MPAPPAREDFPPSKASPDVVHGLAIAVAIALPIIVVVGILAFYHDRRKKRRLHPPRGVLPGRRPPVIAEEAGPERTVPTNPFEVGDEEDERDRGERTKQRSFALDDDVLREIRSMKAKAREKRRVDKRGPLGPGELNELRELKLVALKEPLEPEELKPLSLNGTQGRDSGREELTGPLDMDELTELRELKPVALKGI